MSSKSKKRPQAQRPRKPLAQAAPGAPGARAEAEEKGILSEDVIRVPRGMSRWQFLLLIGLVILLLVSFLVTGPILNIFRGKGAERNPVVLRWNRPGHGTVELRAADLQVANRSLGATIAVDPLAAQGLGLFDQNELMLILMRQRQLRLDRDDIARLLVLDQLAEDAGLVVTDADVAAHLEEFLQINRLTRDDYKRFVQQQLGFDPAGFEDPLRRILRAARFLQIAGYAAAVPDPADIEQQFHRENVEFAFEYAALAPEGLEDEARAELPDEAGLRAWFDGLPEVERNQLRTPEKRRAELALFRSLEATPAAALVEAFPEQAVEGVEPSPPEQLARQYWERVVHRRFVKPPEAGAPAGEEQEATQFRPFEEVEQQCLAEAPVYFAMQRWLDDLKARKTAGEALDLVAEAAKYGLEHRALDAPLSRDELSSLEDLGDRELADAVFQAAPDGSFYYALVVLPGALVVARALERSEPVLPPFEEIRSKVEEKWIRPKAEELAQERLKAVWQGLEEFQPEPEKEEGEEELPEPAARVRRRASAEAFRTAAEAAGLAVERRDWLNRGGPPEADPERDSPAHRFLQTQYDLYELADDEVAEPRLGRDKKGAYLVRLAGKREVPLERMTPVQYERYEQAARSLAMNRLAQSLDLAFLEQHYGLWLYKAEEAEEAEGERAPGGPAPGGEDDLGY